MLAGQQKTCGLIILMCGWFLSFLYDDANRSESQEKKLGTNMALFLSFIIFLYRTCKVSSQGFCKLFA